MASRNSNLASKWDMEERTPEDLARDTIVVRERGVRYAILPKAAKGRDRRGTREFSLAFLDQYDEETADALQVALIMRLFACKGSGSRYNDYRTISRDFHSFLSTRAEGLPRLGDFDDDLLAEFTKWLNEPSSSGYAANRKTRREKVYAVQRMLRHLKLSTEFKHRLSPHLKNLKAPYRGATADTRHVEPIGDGSFDEIYSVAAEACGEIIEELWEPLERLERVRRKPQSLSSARQDYVRCAAFLLQRSPSKICLSYHKAKRTFPGYAAAVDGATHAAAERLLYPVLSEFAPYLIVLASAFALNTGVVTGMKLSDFQFDKFRDVERMRIGPRKGRAGGKRQRHAVTVTDHADNPGKLIRFITMRTRYLREASTTGADLLLLRFDPTSRSVAPPILNGAWTRSLDAFASKHGLDRFLLEQFRSTILQKVHDLTGGDITAVQAYGKQKSLTTIEKHYRTRGMEKAGEDRLYAAMAQRHRDLKTGGVVSPIGKPKKSFDRWAATPGYTCLDTFDSPIQGQKRGLPCTAYGQCPRCELAMTDYGSARDLAYLHQLRRRIDETVATIGPASWIAKWAPVQRELLIDIAMFPPEVEAIVATGEVVISTLPPLE